MAYAFAMSYLNQYPSEKVGPSTFACDDTLRNAKFQSNLQARAVPVSDVEQPIFELLDAQNFTMKVDFLNTAMPCMKVSIVEVIESSTSPLTGSSCRDMNGTLSLSVPLPQHDITVRFVLSDVQLIGGIRMGLEGSSQLTDMYTLQQLNFRQVFSSTSARTLAQQSTVKMAITKVSSRCMIVPLLFSLKGVFF